jgi:hypothetical protein
LKSKDKGQDNEKIYDRNGGITATLEWMGVALVNTVHVSDASVPVS